MERASVRDLKVAYTEQGEGERAFVLLHGYSGCRQDFDPVLGELAASGRTLVPDLRGHGGTSRSPDPARYCFAELVKDLRAFLDARKVRRCDLLGHSMGGMVALRFALAHPERLHSLVLMSTTPRGLDGIERDAFTTAWAVARSAGMETLQKALQARLVNDPERPASDQRCETEWGEGYWNHHRRRFRTMDPEAYARLGPAMLDETPVTDRLGEIAMPTLVLVGAEDEPFLEAADLLERGIYGATRVTLPDAAHHPQRENKAAWLAAVGDHLASVRAVSPGRESAARASRDSP